MISQDELDRLGLPRNSLKVTDPATGKEGYRAAVEVFHQLHCLNLLRQYVYKEYYVNIYSDIQDEEEALKGHIGKSLDPVLSSSIRMLIATSRPLPRGHPDQLDVHGRHRHLHL